MTFDVNGAIEDMDAAVTAILSQLQNGLTVTINGNEYPSNTPQDQRGKQMGRQS